MKKLTSAALGQLRKVLGRKPEGVGVSAVDGRGLEAAAVSGDIGGCYALVGLADFATEDANGDGIESGCWGSEGGGGGEEEAKGEGRELHFEVLWLWLWLGWLRMEMSRGGDCLRLMC